MDFFCTLQGKPFWIRVSLTSQEGERILLSRASATCVGHPRLMAKRRRGVSIVYGTLR